MDSSLSGVALSTSVTVGEGSGRKLWKLEGNPVDGDLVGRRGRVETNRVEACEPVEHLVLESLKDN